MTDTATTPGVTAMPPTSAVTTPIINAATKLLLERIEKAGGGPIATNLLPLADEFATVLNSMTDAQIFTWLKMASRGSPDAAYAHILAKMPAGDLISEWDALNGAWKQANADNAAAIAKQKQIGTAVALGVVKGLTTLALATVGL